MLFSPLVLCLRWISTNWAMIQRLTLCVCVGRVAEHLSSSRSQRASDLCVVSRYQPHTCAAVTIMSSEAALNLSILELIQALNEKLGLECTGAREIRLPSGLASVTALESEVSAPHGLIYLNAAVGSDGQPFRSNASKPGCTMSWGLSLRCGTCCSQ